MLGYYWDMSAHMHVHGYVINAINVVKCVTLFLEAEKYSQNKNSDVSQNKQSSVKVKYP